MEKEKEKAKKKWLAIRHDWKQNLELALESEKTKKIDKK